MTIFTNSVLCQRILGNLCDFFVYDFAVIYIFSTAGQFSESFKVQIIAQQQLVYILDNMKLNICSDAHKSALGMIIDHLIFID